MNDATIPEMLQSAAANADALKSIINYACEPSSPHQTVAASDSSSTIKFRFFLCNVTIVNENTSQ